MALTSLTVSAENKFQCAVCVQRVGRALQRAQGVDEVEARFQTQEVRVTIDNRVLLVERLGAGFEQLGHEPWSQIGTR